MSFSGPRVILTRPRWPGNIAACARACMNFGVSDLRVVSPEDPQWRLAAEVRQLAVAEASDLIAATLEHTSLEEALKGTTRSVAFTRRKGELRGQDVAFSSLEFLFTGSADTALVFGNERNGLLDEEIALCTHMARIPSTDQLASLNLSHAVAVVLARIYEEQGRVRETSPGGSAAAPEPLASHEFREALFARLRDALVNVGLVTGGNPERLLRQFRRYFSQRDLTERDARLWLGYLGRASGRKSERPGSDPSTLAPQEPDSSSDEDDTHQ